jgi:RNA polymerase sigma-70 factor (ECF subfamily)
MTTRGESEEPSLVTRAKQGDLAAFEALYEIHKMAVYRTALAITGDRQTAEEILQEAFLRVFKHINTAREGVSLSPWLYRIAVNLAYDWVGQRRRRQVTLDDIIEQLIMPVAAPPDQTVERQELLSLIHEAIDKLEVRQRVTLVLFYLQDFSLAEIAEIMECPVGTVKSRLHYARQNLRRELLADRRLPTGLIYEFT